MAHWAKVFALKNCQAEFPPQHLHRGKRRASTPQNCPVSSRYVARHVQDLSHNDKPVKLNSIKGYSDVQED